MTKERWRLIENVFAGAADLAPEARDTYLTESCRGDIELLEEVRSMLAIDGWAPKLLQAGIQKEAERLSSDASASVIGQRIGPYRIMGILGRGGMGAVYLAMREDDVYEKPVALKLVKRGMDSDEVIRRFRQERRILSRLDHPNIARLLDGGSADDGRPYFVMEYVEGEPITSFAGSLPLRNRLELFRNVCSAVEYAHRNLVVHRDLKPGNILVTADGTPKLLDFGIAKLLTPDDTGLTVVGMRILTPDYASPEQKRGEAVTTATDVYSLGCMFEKLVGEQALGGELRQIAQKARNEEPLRRYSSVEQFSEDIRRYLAGLPIQARPDTLAYRATKFVRRHRWSAAAVTLATLSLLSTTIFAVRQASEADRQRRAADSARVIAQSEARRADEERVHAVAEARRADNARAEAVVQARRADEARRKTDQQAQWSRRYAAEVASRLNQGLHSISGALDARRELAQATLSALERMTNDSPGELSVRFDLVRAHLTMAMVYYHVGNNSYYAFEPALDNLNQGWKILAQLRQREPGEKRFKALEAALLHQQALTLTAMGRDRESLEAFRRGEALRLDVGDEAMKRIGYPGRAPAGTWAVALMGLGDYRGAIQLLPAGDAYKAAALAAIGDLETGWRWLDGQVPRTARRMGRRYAADTGFPALAKQYLADISGHPLQLNRNDPATALLLTRQNVEVFEQVLAAEPSDGNARDALSRMKMVLGAVLRERDPEESIRSYHEAIEFLKELLKRSASNLTARRRLAAAHAEIALPLRKLGRSNEARESLAASRAIEDSIGAPTAFTRGELGDLELDAGNRESALEHYRTGLRLAEHKIEQRPQEMNARRELADMHEKLARFCESSGDWKQARERYTRSLTVWREWTKYGVSSSYNQQREQAAAAALARLAEKE